MNRQPLLPELRARGALDRRVAAAPDCDHPVDAGRVVRLLRSLACGAAGLADFGCSPGITVGCPGGKGRAVPASPSVTVVKLPAEIDITNAADVRDELLTAFRSGAAVVIADMTGTTFTDTMGVRTLVLAQQHAVANGGQLRLALSSRLLLRVLSAMGFDGYFSIYPTVAEAQAAGTATGESRAR